MFAGGTKAVVVDRSAIDREMAEAAAIAGAEDAAEDLSVQVMHEDTCSRERSRWPRRKCGPGSSSPLMVRAAPMHAFWA